MVYKQFFSTFYIVKKVYLEKKEDHYQLKALEKLKSNEIQFNHFFFIFNLNSNFKIFIII